MLPDKAYPMTTTAPATLFKQSLSVGPSTVASAWGLLLLRGATGLMIFYIHGWHKLLGGIDYLRHGTPWKLVEEIAGMHFPAPLASAFVATVVQLVCGLLLAVGLCTRLSATLLTGALGVAILQNLLSARDPQLAMLYTLIVASFVFIGGGRLSLDAALLKK